MFCVQVPVVARGLPPCCAPDRMSDRQTGNYVGRHTDARPIRRYLAYPTRDLSTNQGIDMQGNNIAGIDGTMTHTVDNASSSVHHVIDRASSAAGPAIDKLASGAHQTTDRVALAANNAVGTLRSAGTQLRNAQTQLTQGCSSYVQDKPLTSLGIAVAGGFLLATLLRLR